MTKPTTNRAAASLTLLALAGATLVSTAALTAASGSAEAGEVCTIIGGRRQCWWGGPAPVPPKPDVKGTKQK